MNLQKRLSVLSTRTEAAIPYDCPEHYHPKLLEEDIKQLKENDFRSIENTDRIDEIEHDLGIFAQKVNQLYPRKEVLRKIPLSRNLNVMMPTDYVKWKKDEGALYELITQKDAPCIIEIIDISGGGKSCFIESFLHSDYLPQSDYDQCLWYTYEPLNLLGNGLDADPNFDDLLDFIIKECKINTRESDTVEGKLNHVVEHLNKKKIFLVIDALENIRVKTHMPYDHQPSFHSFLKTILAKSTSFASCVLLSSQTEIMENRDEVFGSTVNNCEIYKTFKLSKWSYDDARKYILEREEDDPKNQVDKVIESLRRDPLSMNLYKHFLSKYHSGSLNNFFNIKPNGNFFRRPLEGSEKKNFFKKIISLIFDQFSSSEASLLFCICINGVSGAEISENNFYPLFEKIDGVKKPKDAQLAIKTFRELGLIFASSSTNDDSVFHVESRIAKEIIYYYKTNELDDAITIQKNSVSFFRQRFSGYSRESDGPSAKDIIQWLHLLLELKNTDDIVKVDGWNVFKRVNNHLYLKASELKQLAQYLSSDKELYTILNQPLQRDFNEEFFMETFQAFISKNHKIHLDTSPLFSFFGVCVNARVMRDA